MPCQVLLSLRGRTSNRRCLFRHTGRVRSAHWMKVKRDRPARPVRAQRTSRPTARLLPRALGVVMLEPPHIRAARQHLAQAESGYQSEDGLFHLEEGLALLDEMMAWDAPAQTITTGFGSPGQGRYLHPSRLRTLSPHEAARLQFFPDWFDFSAAKNRREIAQSIGNAVPPKLAFVLSIAMLHHLFARAATLDQSRAAG